MSNVRKIKFTPEEDEKLKKLIKQLGTRDWEVISIEMKTRTSRQCRDRWNNYLCPNLSNDPFTEDEDQLLLQLFEKYGPKWKKIGSYFPKRSTNRLRGHLASLQKKKEQIPPKKQEDSQFPSPSPDPLAQFKAMFSSNNDPNLAALLQMDVDPFADLSIIEM
ncbi:Myb-like DNA-binding domain containing protein [Trichomonas vaginalis G3]|uniref:Myb-like DNA-binding domain containing protein n=1 Tax=Trichomonas vaginalis (strain ATCC PRA-98 / G3) TaxID=412133 RepID=A2D981_TRIV3|nr:RNA polymerase II transcription regulator recruiting protein [Trichomonas vaginalis G3]EAY23107.1 Myb-like DNA-binding domain containing protein [Trichomonas vaginalis G3]KAI5513835.1 RNA polymerase II transcription regulator recruiting protein [Trichomonas vaginalis G3]|eukprot:XP_001584093.1 Myb-like DNA-binding domain containing protein [Trichomonas vaginalis G3]